MSGLLQDLVSAQAAHRPHAPAIIWQDQVLSYRDVELGSNRLARALSEAGCARGDRVCLLAPKSATAIVALLAVYKADCVYVPLDPGNPAARLGKIIGACEPRAILVAPSSIALLEELSRAHTLHTEPLVVGLSDKAIFDPHVKTAFCLSDLTGVPDHRPLYQNRAASPAHILFTSGSTGTPKGVVITHANVRHFISWANAYFGTVPSDRQSGHSPLAFDLSIYDIFGTLAAGASLFPVPLEANVLPDVLAEFIRKHQLTQWFSVPSVLKFLAQHDVVAPNDFPSLKRVLWCGEALSVPVLRYWMTRLPHVTFTNLYGPTETTIASSYYTVRDCPADDHESVPIGVACQGEELYVLDDALQPVPPETLGEIYIRGVGLSPGYWRDSNATRQAFLPNPNASESSDRIYRTGDLGRRGSDELFYFAGRRDAQVKSRGHRIELGEVEAALSTLPSLSDAAVVALELETFEGTALCCGYVPAAGRQVTVAALRKQLAKLVPTYMLPTRWKAFDQLPLNANGKTDRVQVQRWFAQAEAFGH